MPLRKAAVAFDWTAVAFVPETDDAGHLSANASTAFARLRHHSYAALPDLLAAAGGSMAKEDLRREVWRGFTEVGGDVDPEIDLRNGAGTLRWINAVAWALSDLERDGRIAPCAGRER